MQIFTIVKKGVKVQKRFVFEVLMGILFCSVNTFCSDYSIVLVHVGDSLPAYIQTCVKQIRMFNNCDVFLICNRVALEKKLSYLERYNVTCVPCESLQATKAHISFLKRTPIGKNWVRAAIERFFYIEALMFQYDLKNVFHMEYDNMLYVDLSELVPVFEQKYSAIAATFDNDMRCIAGFMYIKNCTAINLFAQYLAHVAPQAKLDMQILAFYRAEMGFDKIDHLPIITKEYVIKNKLLSFEGCKAENPVDYCKNIDAFNSVFDAAALGQHLGGTDPKNGPCMLGFINESCVFNPSFMRYEWSNDSKGRAVPYIHYDNKKFRINNLHIHSKRLHQFLSSK
jgi:hypothetical protein